MLGLVVTAYIFERYPGLSEGKLAKLRAAVVSAVSLAAVGRELGLGQALLLGKGERSSGGRDKPSLLADAVEAVIGAVYLDGGWQAARRLVLELFADQIEAAAHQPGIEDYKTRLQELVAREFESLPTYDVSDEGPDHEKHFFATVTVDGAVFGTGEGRSKKEAEQAAAGAAWERLADQLADLPAAAGSGGADNTPAEAVP